MTFLGGARIVEPSIEDPVWLVRWLLVRPVVSSWCPVWVSWGFRWVGNVAAGVAGVGVRHTVGP